jgi:tetratricopeptide (TPR) repeat protein
MRSSAFLGVVAAALVSTSFLSLMPASALTQQQIDWCVNSGNMFSLDQQISGCTAVIQSGRFRGKNLAIAFSNRCGGYNEKGENDRALADCNQAIRLDPKDAFAYNNRGNAYNAEGDYDRAIADFTEAIRLDPKLAFAYNGRGVAYRHKGDLDRAIADYTEAIQLNPNYANAYYNRGLAWEIKNDLQKALADYKRFVELNPSDPDGSTAITRVTKALGQ